MNRTTCESCDNVHADTRSKEPYRWRCIKFPVLPGMSAVSPSWRPDPPYAKCEDINHGHCPVWAPKRTPLDDIQF